MSSRFCAVSSEPNPQISGSDLILPCQYYDISGGHRLTGEQRLMLAMLTDAINVYQKGVLSRLTRARRLYVDAEHWIMREGPVGNALPFDTVCDALGINPAMLRRRIIAWKHAVHRQCEDHPAPRTRIKVSPRMRAARNPGRGARAASRAS
jgi:hypothetical protein